MPLHTVVCVCVIIWAMDQGLRPATLGSPSLCSTLFRTRCAIPKWFQSWYHLISPASMKKKLAVVSVVSLHFVDSNRMFCLNVHVLKHPIWLTRWEPRTPTRVHPLDCQTRSLRSCGWYVLHQCPFDCGSGTIESSSCGIYTSRHTISSLAKTSPCYDSSCTPCVSSSAPQNCSHPLRQKVLCTNVGMFNSCHVTSNSENQGTRWASRQNLRCWASRTPGLPETTSFKWEKKWLVSNNPQKTIENHDKIHVFLEIVHNEKTQETTGKWKTRSGMVKCYLKCGGTVNMGKPQHWHHIFVSCQDNQLNNFT